MNAAVNELMTVYGMSYLDACAEVSRVQGAVIERTISAERAMSDIGLAHYDTVKLWTDVETDDEIGE